MPKLLRGFRGYIFRESRGPGLVFLSVRGFSRMSFCACIAVLPLQYFRQGLHTPFFFSVSIRIVWSSSRTHHGFVQACLATLQSAVYASAADYGGSRVAGGGVKNSGGENGRGHVGGGYAGLYGGSVGLYDAVGANNRNTTAQQRPPGTAAMDNAISWSGESSASGCLDNGGLWPAKAECGAGMVTNIGTLSNPREPAKSFPVSDLGWGGDAVAAARRAIFGLPGSSRVSAIEPVGGEVELCPVGTGTGCVPAAPFTSSLPPSPAPRPLPSMLRRLPRRGPLNASCGLMQFPSPPDSVSEPLRMPTSSLESAPIPSESLPETGRSDPMIQSQRHVGAGLRNVAPFVNAATVPSGTAVLRETPLVGGDELVGMRAPLLGDVGGCGGDVLE